MVNGYGFLLNVGNKLYFCRKVFTDACVDEVIAELKGM